MANLNLSPSGGALKYIIDLIYPVKSYFITENTDLNTPEKVKAHFHGIGEWEQLPEGTFIEATAGSPTNHDAGLPNITGTVDSNIMSHGGNSGTGALKFVQLGTAKSSGSTTTPYGRIELNANWLGDLYGNSTTVQPKSRTAYIYRRKS